jgi:hypothetical protein
MRFAILTILALVAACSAEAAGPSSAPIHVVVVCTKSCDATARRDLFRRWVARALGRAGSRFEVWHAGARRGFATEVPPRWPAPVTASRADFIARGEERATTDGANVITETLSVSSDAEVAVLGAPELESAVRLGLVATEPAHLALVCDRSSSTLGVSCRASTVRRAAIAWLEHGGVLEGASFEILVPGHGYDSARRIIEHHVASHAVGERVALALAAVDAVSDAVAHDRGAAGSAIAETIRLAVDGLADRRGARSLVVLSDLRQYTPGRWNFERQVPSPAVFSKWLAREGLAVDLHGIDVAACGTHHMRGMGAGSFDARMAREVVELWSGVFRDGGAAGARIVSDCDASMSAASAASRVPGR